MFLIKLSCYSDNNFKYFMFVKYNGFLSKARVAACMYFLVYFISIVMIYRTSTRVEIGKTRNCVETRRPKGGVFSHNFEFSQFPRVTSVDITIYQYGKNVLYLFYNIAQRNIKEEIFRRFRVVIELYQHGS
jgi:hypothetical protein